MLGCIVYFLTTYNLSAQVQIKLIGFTSNGQNIDNFVKWNAGETSYQESYPVDYIGVLVGSSVYNSNIGEYYSRVLVSENEEYVSKMFRYRTQNNTISLSEVSSFFNGSAEVDMLTGMLYSYDGNSLENDLYLNRYNPFTQTSTNLGYYQFNPNTIFYPDSSGYDSDNGIYYFIIQDGDGKKLVKSNINSETFSYTVIPLFGETITGNIGLEYSNQENTLHIIYTEYNSSTGTSTINVGYLNGETGQITNLVNLIEVDRLQLFNRTYDQNTETLIFIGFDLNNQQRIYLYNTLTDQLVNYPLPPSVIYEIEADNFIFAQNRYTTLGIDEKQISTFSVNPNPIENSFYVNFEGTTAEYELFDVIGKSVQKGIVQNSQEINVSKLRKGVYVINIKTANFNENKKIIII